MDIRATFSAEDNKLRLYASERLDSELYARIKKIGFSWAPHQKLFVAPRWTPEAEDICIELAGEIEPEQTTLVERAEAKAERLDSIAHRRELEGNTFCDAARRISQRFEFGQPIIVGHHSERSARNDQKKMHNQMDKASKAFKAIDYWKYRAEGVEHHANRKGSQRTRINRIKKLLADLRGFQRNTNHANHVCKVWMKIEIIDDAETLKTTVLRMIDSRGENGPMSLDIMEQVESGEITYKEACRLNIEAFTKSVHSIRRARWINHVLNRLAFETQQLGEVPRYSGELTATILQLFTRTHGADKPKAALIDGQWNVTSSVPLPVHLVELNSPTLTLSDSDWKTLMVNVGFEVVIKERRKSTKPKAAPLINPSESDAKLLQDKWNESALSGRYGKLLVADKLEGPALIKQETYSANSGGAYSKFESVSLDENGDIIRVHWDKPTPESVCRVRIYTGNAQLYGPSRLVVLTDKSTKSLPFDLTTDEQKQVNG